MEFIHPLIQHNVVQYAVLNQAWEYEISITAKIRPAQDLAELYLTGHSRTQLKINDETIRP